MKGREIKELLTDSDLNLEMMFLGAGLILIPASLACLPGTEYSLPENLVRTAGSVTGLASGAALIYYPIKNTIELYKRLDESDKPHKIIQRNLQKVYYKLRRKES